MPSLCIGAETPTPRRPASGSVLSLAALCRHVVLQDPGKLSGLLAPSSFTHDAGLRPKRKVSALPISHTPISRERVHIGTSLRFALAATCRLARPPFVGADQVFPQPTEAFTSGLSTDRSLAPPPDITTGATGQVPLTGLSPIRMPTSIAATAHRTGQADFPHPALGKDAHRTEVKQVTPSATSEPSCGVARLNRQSPGPLLLLALAFN